MRSKTAQRLLDKTTQETKNKVRRYSERMVEANIQRKYRQSMLGMFYIGILSGAIIGTAVCVFLMY
jgi:ABC-type polysaccharide/polyol phosphate export permease